MCVGINIKKYLENRGISQAFISAKTKIPNNTLSNMLSGKRKITVEEYFLICEALQKPYDFFNTYSA